jgi:hypothetical protein
MRTCSSHTRLMKRIHIRKGFNPCIRGPREIVVSGSLLRSSLCLWTKRKVCSNFWPQRRIEMHFCVIWCEWIWILASSPRTKIFSLLYCTDLVTLSLRLRTKWKREEDWNGLSYDRSVTGYVNGYCQFTQKQRYSHFYRLECLKSCDIIPLK